MKKIRKYVKLIILISIAVISVLIDFALKSEYDMFSEINKILFSLVTVIAGFWVTCYLLFIQIYKDRYPLKFIKNKYLPVMKYNLTYILYCVIFGCFIIVKNGGVVENF